VNTNSAAEFGNIIIIIIINVSKRFTPMLFAQLYTGRHHSRHCSEQVSSSPVSVSLFLCSSFNPRYSLLPTAEALHYLHSQQLADRLLKNVFVEILIRSRTCVLLGKKGSPYSITERRFPEPIPVLGSQPAGDVSHNPGSRLPLLSARPAVTPATLRRAATNCAAW